MKKLRYIPALLGVMAVAGAFADAEVVRISPRGPSVRVAETRFDIADMWVDTIGFGSDEVNYGSPDTIAMWRGAPVTFGYDYNSLQHVLMHDGAVLAANPDLLMTSNCKDSNTVVFKSGTRSATVDFNSAGVLHTLDSLIAPPAGWETGGLTYSYDIIIDEGDYGVLMPYDRRFIAEYPQDKKLAAALFRLLGEDITMPVYDTDTVYMFDTPPVDFASFVNQMAEMYSHADGMRRAVPNRKVTPMQGWNETRLYAADMVLGDLVTVALTINETYPAGGCRNSSTSYATYDLAAGRKLSFGDIFADSYADDVKRLYLSRVADVVNTNGIWDGYDYETDESVPATAADVLERLAPDEEEGRGALHLLTTCDDVALSPQGVIFSYPMSAFWDFDELPDDTFIVPYADCARFMRPEVAGLLGLKIGF